MICFLSFLFAVIGSFIMGFCLRGMVEKAKPRAVEGSHAFDPISNGIDECECGLIQSAPVHHASQ